MGRVPVFQYEAPGPHVARESRKDKRARAVAVDDALQAAYPQSTCALDHRDPFELLVATMLSAQTTDIAVNQVTPDLFAAYPDAAAMADAEPEDVEPLINSIGLWRNKAKHVVAMSRVLRDEHGGQVPKDLAQLVALSGVGRKTATAVLGTAFGIPAGITVDTHMLRINRLLKLSTAKSADKMGSELEALLPEDRWTGYTHRIIDHGRMVCVARRPRCGVCPLAKGLCPGAFSPKEGYQPKNDERLPASAKGISWRSRMR